MTAIRRSLNDLERNAVAGNATDAVKLQVKGSANVRKGQPVKPSAQPTLVRIQHLPPCDLSRHRGHREPALGPRWFPILGAGWPAGRLRHGNFRRCDWLPALAANGLARGWILSGLNAHKAETVQSTIEKISADVQRLRELVA